MICVYRQEQLKETTTKEIKISACLGTGGMAHGREKIRERWETKNKRHAS
jgi:hypothetical protein